MPQSKETQAVIERLIAINARLKQALFESEIARVRLLKARRDANTWPTIPSFVSFTAKAPTESN